MKHVKFQLPTAVAFFCFVYFFGGGGDTAIYKYDIDFCIEETGYKTMLTLHRQ